MPLTSFRRAGRRGLSRRSTEQPSSNAGDGCRIDIGDEVVVPLPQRFGVNLEIPDARPWLSNALLLNNWVADSGLEPVVLRHKGTAIGGDATTIESSANLMTSAAGRVTDGFFDGAEARVYRAVEGSVQPVRIDRVSRFLASDTSGYRIILADEGPVIEAGDVYFLAMVCVEVPVTSLHPRANPIAAKDVWQVYPPGGDRSAVRARRDSSNASPRYGSRSSMRITIETPIEGGISQAVAGSSARRNMNALDPGVTYRVEMWLRQERVYEGAVAVWLAPFRKTTEHTFRVTGEWARYSFTFSGPARVYASSLCELHIAFRGPGTVWVDDVRLFDTSQAPHAIRPEVIGALHAYRPGSLRIWSGQTNRAWGTSLESWIAPEGQALRRWDPTRGAIGGERLSLPTALELARRIEADPWLIVHPSFDEAEWLNLMEYLAGPPTSPYGERRASSGQDRPWIEEFSRIYIELGNETWNPFFHPWTFESGTQYGQFAEYFFGIARSSPFFAAVADRITFVAGGFYLSTGAQSYGARAAEASPSTSLVAGTTFLLGSDLIYIPSTDPEERFRQVLLYSPWILKYLVEQEVATHRLFAKAGVSVRLGTSECAPGYQLPSPDEGFEPVGEIFGKSLASAVSMVDGLCIKMMLGYEPQLYYSFGAGEGWSSHTRLSEGFRPHPTWLATQLWNRHAQGEMIETTVSNSPTIDIPPFPSRKKNIPGVSALPLIAAHAFRTAAGHAIFVLSRHLSQSTEITLHLPGEPSSLTLYTLTGDPRANNLESMRIKVRRRVIRRFGREYRFTMPPGSIYLFVTNERV